MIYLGHVWPFNYYLMWTVLVGVTAAMYWQSTQLPSTLDAMKQAPDSQHEKAHSHQATNE